MFITKESGMQIVRELKATIGRDVNIMDRTGTIIASTDPERIGQAHAIAQRIIQEGLPALEVSQTEAAPGVQEGINLPIHVDGICEGVIGITGPAEDVRGYGTITKKMTEILLLAIRRQEQQAALEQAKNLFLEEWLFSRQVDWSAFALHGDLLGIDTALPRRVAILMVSRPPADKTGTLPAELRSSNLLQTVRMCLPADPQTICAVVNQRVLILFRGTGAPHPKQILEEIRRQAAAACGLHLQGGISTLSKNAADLRRCYHEAKIAAQAALREQAILEYSNTSVEFVLQNIDAKVRRNVCQAVLSAIPQEEQDDLLECLELYYQCQGSMEQTASRLCVHKNTVRYRLGKLRQYTGYDLRRPRDSALLYITLQFLKSEEGTESPVL